MNVADALARAYVIGSASAWKNASAKKNASVRKIAYALCSAYANRGASLLLE